MKDKDNVYDFSAKLEEHLVSQMPRDIRRMEQLLRAAFGVDDTESPENKRQNAKDIGLLKKFTAAVEKKFMADDGFAEEFLAKATQEKLANMAMSAEGDPAKCSTIVCALLRARGFQGVVMAMKDGSALMQDFVLAAERTQEGRTRLRERLHMRQPEKKTSHLRRVK